MTRSIFTDEYKHLRRILRRERINADLNQVPLSQKLNMPDTYVNKYELGERRIDLIEFLDIVEAIGCDPHKIIDEILEEKEQNKNE